MVNLAYLIPPLKHVRFYRIRDCRKFMAESSYTNGR